jgi:hypothetical protein
MTFCEIMTDKNRKTILVTRGKGKGEKGKKWKGKR